ncbi:RmlC-like cupin domain-containing protein [Vararia minispora EC-137]|uniref:RmlC-like cupin domain-containing protein n=1 Tax=Vararia minispora EC-137 TaxID=1314806 RepID=A0ACB8QI22_9AGAM|nr:RmlC-like cupin domain-containing protein [Vararia minispora EC-137]
MSDVVKPIIAALAPPIPDLGEPESGKLFRIRGQVHDYGWGKPSSSSLVAALAIEGGEENFKPKPQHPYAELWMGTHACGPLTLYSAPSRKLSDVFAADPEYWLGHVLVEKWPGTCDIPFIFKILSIAKALPLQAHPDKQLGTQLHKTDPYEFVDENHKPEIAVALGTPVSDAFGGDPNMTTFTGFVGFAPLNAISGALSAVPELAQAVGDERALNEFFSSPSKVTLKRIFSALLVRGKDFPDDIKRSVDQLLARISASSNDDPLAMQFALAKRINEQYAGDVGVLAAPFFMNLIRLKKGEAIYIGADEAHAYLEGDIVECMAISDNVLNAAFVPHEQRHLRTFLDTVTYTSREQSHWILPVAPLERSVRGKTTKFSPPLEEFEVLHTVLDQSGTETIRAARGPTVAIVVEGCGITFEVEGERLETIPRGGVVFVVPGKEVTVEGEGEVWWATTHDLA